MSINNRLINAGAEGCPPYILTADSYVSGVKGGLSVNTASAPDGIAVSPDGTKMLVNGSGRLQEFTMSTPHNITTASFNREIIVDGRAKDLCFSSTGHRLYLNSREYTLQYNLSTPYSLLGASSSGNSQQWNPFPDPAFDVNGISIAADGTKLFASKIESSQNKVYLQNLSTPWELSSSTGSYLQGFIGDGSYASGFSYSNDGLNLIIHADKVVQYWSLTTPFNFSTATNLQNITLTTSSYGVGGIDYSNGLFVYVSDDYGNKGYQISVCG